MKRQSFAGDRSGNSIPSRDSWIEWLWILGLFAVALLLFTTALGTVALRDWDEGTVAQVAKEIWQAPPGSFRWLFPTQWG
ncbi:MAG: phospholipid carrier-dependent glycosyltransferase, partial [Cyanobacteriota bacterium]